MKRISAALLSVIMLTACSEKPVSSEQNPSAAETAQTTETTDDYDPFAAADNGSDEDETIGKSAFGVEWEEGKELVLDYAPTVTFPYYVDNSAGQSDFGLLIFVNGFRQPYRTDAEPDDRILHTFTVEKNERIHPKISFEPIVGELGETLSVEIISMFRPGFALTDQTTDSALNFNHRILALYPSELTVTQHTELTEPAVCKDYTAVPITEEIRAAYANQDGNPLDRLVYLEPMKNDVLITPEDRRKEEIPKTVFRGVDTMTLCMFGGGKPCKYRVSMYLDHELVSGAFDGCDYIDMMPSADTMCKKMIDTQKLHLPKDGYSHFYFIAVPFYTNKNYDERYTVKSETAAIM